ncbi:kinase-like protein [Fistulina hepatica ATCC 64428]|uniref:Kinase-like protein n=1 Tax=Fistulina hepatica ATCC 64428 TaxID=1128425 RepID=A0A0D6ZZ33_9AGAR|nr:kinase-like protein [Fistulina hepatica ATCC 64428]
MEYENMRFLYESTNIPIPRPICWFNVPFGPDEVQWGYLLTSRMPGRPLSETWLSLSHADKCVIIQQLATYMRQLRSIPPPPNPLIGSVAGRPVRCFRLTALNPVGPFHDEEHLNRHLRGPRSSQMPPTVMQTHAKRHALVFSHNDLFPKNILVEGTKITAIVDWESSGWFPEHFEYCCQKYAVCDDFDADWASFVPEFLDEWEEEVQADEAIKKVYESFRVTWDTVE